MSSVEAYGKPIPVADPDSAPFWQGCRDHRLLLQHCDDCSHVQFPPSSVCARCGGGALSWKQASGAGKVFSWIVVRHPVPKQVYASDVPYVVALVELTEGVRVPSNIIGCKPEQVVADMPVQVTFKQVADEVVLPLFQPA
jgi:uncharacterized OB-fold protein